MEVYNLHRFHSLLGLKFAIFLYLSSSDMVDATCLIGLNTVWDQVQPFRPVQTNQNHPLLWVILS